MGNDTITTVDRYVERYGSEFHEQWLLDYYKGSYRINLSQPDGSMRSGIDPDDVPDEVLEEFIAELEAGVDALKNNVDRDPSDLENIFPPKWSWAGILNFKLDGAGSLPTAVTALRMKDRELTEAYFEAKDRRQLDTVDDLSEVTFVGIVTESTPASELTIGPFAIFAHDKRTEWYVNPLEVVDTYD